MTIIWKVSFHVFTRAFKINCQIRKKYKICGIVCIEIANKVVFFIFIKVVNTSA